MALKFRNMNLPHPTITGASISVDPANLDDLASELVGYDGMFYAPSSVSDAVAVAKALRFDRDPPKTKSDLSDKHLQVLATLTDGATFTEWQEVATKIISASTFDRYVKTLREDAKCVERHGNGKGAKYTLTEKGKQAVQIRPIG